MDQYCRPLSHFFKKGKVIEMSKKCNPPCMRTASHDGRGHRIMVSLPGNEKFPIPHTPHPQCSTCAEEDRDAKFSGGKGVSYGSNIAGGFSSGDGTKTKNPMTGKVEDSNSGWSFNWTTLLG